VSDEQTGDTGRTAAPTPEVAVLDVDGVGAVAVGAALWGVAFVLTLLFRGPLADAGNGWWTWVCLTGVVLGLLGLWYVRRRRDAYRRAAAEA
jgi:hypothetical protein